MLVELNGESHKVGLKIMRTKTKGTINVHDARQTKQEINTLVTVENTFIWGRK